MFYSKNKKKQVYPCVPQFCYIKVGYKGDLLHGNRGRRKIIVRSFGSSKIFREREDGPYCTISGNEPTLVTLYKTGSESQTFLLEFQEFTSV